MPLLFALILYLTRIFEFFSSRTLFKYLFFVEIKIITIILEIYSIMHLI